MLEGISIQPQASDRAEEEKWLVFTAIINIEKWKKNNNAIASWLNEV